MAFVLLVEDHDDTRELYAVALRAAGHQVHAVANGEEGVHATHLVRPHVLVTDIFMPFRDGLELIREARERLPTIKIIAISGGWNRSGGYDVLNYAKDFGADLILRKPITPALLVEAVRALVGQERHAAGQGTCA